MTWHPEILSRTQLGVLSHLGPTVSEKGFYLAGGTALALHLGHRRSMDLDWFTAASMAEPLYLAQHLRDHGIPFVTAQVAPGTLHGSVRGIRVSFFEYRYPLLRPLRSWRPGQSRLASRPDLAAMKLAAIAQRGAKKDFVDIFALGSRSLSLRQMLLWYQEKYSVSEIGHLLYSLAYFDEADRERSPRLFWRVSWQTMKQTIRQWLGKVTEVT
jgi:hypothetical protein